MHRCTFCHDEIGAVHWAFDGVSEQPVPACRECCERLRLKVWKVEAREASDKPARADCVYCGVPLPSADTRPVIVWVRGEHGVEAVCNACRIRYGRETQYVTLPDADWDETDWPQDNAAMLRQLFDEGQIDLRRGELFERPPAPLPGAPVFGAPVDAALWDRVEGMLLGIAIGDALGNTTEGMTPADRRAQYGEVRDYLPQNGHYIVRKASGGRGVMNVKNGNRTDGVVVLTRTSSRRAPVIACYVRGRRSATITGIPDGKYWVYYTLGRDWNTYTDGFFSTGERGVFSDPCAYSTSSYTTSWSDSMYRYTQGHVRYTNWSITLNPVIGGNARTSSVSQNEFPRAH